MENTLGVSKMRFTTGIFNDVKTINNIDGNFTKYYNNSSDFINNIGQKILSNDKITYFEYLQPNQLTKLYLDYDLGTDEPVTEDLREWHCKNICYPAILEHICKHIPEMTMETHKILEYTREGNGYYEKWEKNKLTKTGYKISLRFVLNICIRHEDIKLIVDKINESSIMKNASKKLGKLVRFDPQVYNPQNKLNMLGCHKQDYEGSSRFVKSYFGIIDAYDLFNEDDLKFSIVQDLNCFLYSSNNLMNYWQNINDDELSNASTASIPEQTPQQQTQLTDDAYFEWAHMCPNTSSERDTWINVLRAFKNESTFENFQIWSSKHLSKYDPRDDLKKWDEMERYKNSYGIGTLCHVLKNENLDLYLQWRKKHFKNNKEIWDVMNKPNHSDFAKLYAKNSKGDFIYSAISGWWNYNKNNVLEGDENGFNVTERLLSNITETLQELFNEQKNMINGDDENFKKKMDTYNRAYIKAGDAGYINSTMKYLNVLLCIDNFEKIKDNKHNLFAFNDYVFDVLTGKYRKIERNDFISVTTGYNKPSKLNPQSEKLCNDFLFSIFEDEELTQYLLKTIGISLFKYVGKLNVFTGRGGNGKSAIAGMLKNAIGNYYHSSDSSFLTTKFRSGAPNNTLYDSDKKRIFIVEEPSKSEEMQENKALAINVAFMKQITDCKSSLKARATFGKKDKDFKPIFNLFLLCNELPEFGTGDAIARRLNALEFPFCFKESQLYNPENPKHRRANPTLCKLCEDDLQIRDVFISKLLKVAHDNYETPEIIAPEKVIEKTKDVLENSNWISPYYEIKKGSKIVCSQFHKHVKSYEPSRSESSICTALFGNDIERKRIDGINVYKDIICRHPEVNEESSEED